jgi:hypothetical protein
LPLSQVVGWHSPIRSCDKTSDLHKPTL